MALEMFEKFKIVASLRRDEAFDGRFSQFSAIYLSNALPLPVRDETFQTIT